MPQGSIKFLNHEKRYGFLTVDGGGEIFFHISGVSKDIDTATLLKGTRVEFAAEKGKKGPQATNVRKA